MSRRRKILLVAAVVLGGLLIIPVARHYQLKRAVKRCKAELKASGELMELAEVIPSAIPAEQNSAAAFTNAFSLFTTNNNVLSTNRPFVMKMVAPGKAAAGWKFPFVQEYPGNRASNSWEDVFTSLKQEEPALKALRQLPDNPVFDFGVDYSKGFTKITFPPLSPAKTAVMRLSVSCSASLRHGDADAACQDIQTMLAISGGIAHDRMLISQLVRYALLQISLASTWEFLQSTNVNEGELAELQSAFSRQGLWAALEQSMILERVVGDIDLEIMRSKGLDKYFDSWEHASSQEFEKGFWADCKIHFKTFVWRYWWTYEDEERAKRGLQVVIEAIRQIEENRDYLTANTRVENYIGSLNINPDLFWFDDPAKSDFRYIQSSSLASMARSLNRAAKADTACQMTAAAIALKRYYLRNSHYPPNLNALVPELISSVPLDPMDSQPLRYRLNADGSFTLYSIAENGRDDGGNPALADEEKSQSPQWQNSNALDWVWPQLATPLEIETFFAEQAEKDN